MLAVLGVAHWLKTAENPSILPIMQLYSIVGIVYNLGFSITSSALSHKQFI